ncbi:hypothetical protein K439DRAFT_1640475 [Ramaria rubella]|nr:hypothetical protein K439DRAFT_1643430 [Ramaria rubella]KAF8576498.1 hypothetical protein K439DRAFT_1640475 [Ramaria rubella]
MDGWRDILHFDFHGEHVLFSSLRLNSGFTFILASLLTVALCALEKYLSYILTSKRNHFPSHNPRLGIAIFRTGLYWVLTLIRLLYMLLAMTFHVGLILVVVTSLSAGQFVIEYLEATQPKPERHIEASPLLGRRRGLNLAGSAEYLAASPPLQTTEYPPRRQQESHNQNISLPKGNGDSSIVFATDDGEDMA